MSAVEVAERHARQQQVIARQAAGVLARLWRQVDRGSIGGSWRQLLPEALTVLVAAQTAAAAASERYLTDVVDAYGVTAPAVGQIAPGAFSLTASDGRPLASLLYQPAITALRQIAAGQTPARGLASGAAVLDMIARTQVADAGRTADAVGIVARPSLSGYVRVLSQPSCARCIILAGKRFRWNAGFRRHPRCDCRHLPVAGFAPDDVRVRPKAYFDSLSAAEQDKTFGKAGAEAIREGADIARVVNARRGMVEADGRLFTTEAAGRRPRLMPEQIMRDAKDRDDAIRLLERNGYIVRRPAPRPAPKPPTFAERVQAGVTDRRRLGGGTTAQTERVTLADGSTAIYKKASDNVGIPAVDQQDAEELGALVARAAGLRAPEVYRASTDEVYMTLMPGEVADELAGDVLEALRDSDEGSRLGLADLLMGNFDRNGGNLLVSGGRIAAIDHGAAFQWYPGLNEPGRPPRSSTTWFARFVDAPGDEWAANPLSRADVETLRQRLNALRPEFARLNRSDWFEGMMGRLAAIARYANGRGLL